MHSISVAGQEVEVVRKAIKNLHLGVYPPNGRVRVAAPMSMNDEAVRLAVSSKLSWIKRQQTRFRTQERQPQRQYTYRESHYYLGRRYLLNVIEQDGHARVSIRNSTTMDLSIPTWTDTTKRERIMQEWYRKELKALIPGLIEKWEPIIGVNVEFWGVRKMKTKWGSCNSKAGRIWLNLELAKKPVQCLEYIVVHEMLHLLERRHNDEFRELLNKFMPLWQQYQDELNRAPLGHEKWRY
jgi:predicted metal-dependent hydrolase